MKWPKSKLGADIRGFDATGLTKKDSEFHWEPQRQGNPRLQSIVQWPPRCTSSEQHGTATAGLQ